ncbi:hypothetical protein Vretimale_9573 [Volvox reticuliferus]|uniref:non-specific serine/threonine protein kinase n=1 Tax=Volvox reticuliferus TaxID=1737510 RepID=A0A8J4CY72_9CHLO|nr:hypothetical protein Vretifemale_18797 [Volvox reticuliferus]GIM05094.1 hypothetical protein Vretimale_9573 [Volvox reticuliferus]
MAVAAAAALPAMFQAGGPAASFGGSDSRSASKRYRKYELLGQGAQKKVYRAFDEERGMEVAWNEVAVAELARFREKDQQRVFAEIRVLKQLKHKNIMTLYDYWFDERRLMLVFITEIFPDGTLRQYRRRHKHADLPAIKRWAWQILQGLVYLHGHNPPIIHRDLKCDNIFVCGSSGTVKIGDLGLVTLCRDFTAPQSVLGTPEFMAPELYEEKYDEKVDVYAFGMCLLELVTMEYPYCECKNAAQIYKKVTQGIPPASVEKLASAELRDFVMLCLCHDPSRRPEARQLLKHPFFEAIRATPSHINGCGTPPKLTVVSSICSATPATSRPSTLTGSGSVTAATLAGAAGFGDGLSPAELSRSSSANSTIQITASGSRSSGGGFDVAMAAAAIGSIAAAAGGGVSATAVATSTLPIAAAPRPYLQLQLPLASIAVSLSPQPASPISAVLGASYAVGHGECGSACIATAAVPMPVAGPLAVGEIGGSIAAAAAMKLAPNLGGCQMGVSPLSVCGLGSIASSLSPTARPITISSAFSSVVVESAALSPGITQEHSAAATMSGDSPALSYQSSITSRTASVGVSGQSSPASGLTAALHSSQLQGCGDAAVASVLMTGPRSVAVEFPATAVGPRENIDASEKCGIAMAIGNSYAAKMAEARSQLAAAPHVGVTPSAAAIAAAAVNAAAAAVGAANGLSLSTPIGLPAIQEDHELHEDMMFEYGSGRRGTHCAGNGGSEDEDDSEGEDAGEDDCGYSEDSLGGPAAPTPAVVCGCRSQPVSLKVRSSGQAAMTNMALSFAMSFTNQRGVRKKVGFQYDLLHDTASAIAVEMVENLSLNTAEAEAIAAMIQHEVSRYNAQQQQQ